ncbi:MAG: aminotransferase class III-fold pyridoxal phosphate-dependent enzyme [Eubacteriales bacterium]
MSAYFDEFPGNVAAVIVAADYQNFELGSTFYPFLREITRINGALLIYDEIVTGFRVALGGVQEYFGVNPDLCVFAKAIANGMPLSVYAGSREIMATCERRGFSISSTYGGRRRSPLAACKATIETFRSFDVSGHIREHGRVPVGQRSITASRQQVFRWHSKAPPPVRCLSKAAVRVRGCSATSSARRIDTACRSTTSATSTSAIRPTTVTRHTRGFAGRSRT